MYAQVAIKPNPLLRNGAYGIVMRGVQKCTRGCSSLRGRNKLPLCCIKLDTATDCYCGTGTISLYLAQKARKVYGIEIVEPAIKDANENAKANNIANAEFICGDAALEMPALLKSGVKPDTVLLDPPRAGCDKKVLAAIAGVKPEKIVYVSCNPASLARDMAFLTENGYKAVKAQPVDMFPMTVHIETVALLMLEK